MTSFQTRLLVLVLACFALGCGGPSRVMKAKKQPTVSPDAVSPITFPDAVQAGCSAAEALKRIASTEGEISVDGLRQGVLKTPPEHICWVEEDKACGDDHCPQHSPLAALTQLHDGPYGYEAFLKKDDAARHLFMGHLARGLDAAAEAEDKPTVAMLIDGLSFERFLTAHNGSAPGVDDARFETFFKKVQAELKAWAIQNAVPRAMADAKKALETLSQERETEEEAKAKQAARAKAIREREHEKIRAELQRRLLELQEAAERARRAAEVAREARQRFTPKEETVEVPEEAAVEAAVDESQPGDALRCRQGAAARVVGESPLRATAADIYCLVREAKATPKLVPAKEVKRLTALFTSLQETVISLELEDLRWALADPAGAEALLDELEDIPLVSKAWKKRMRNQVVKVCTDHLTTLAKSEHEDIILADQWVGACFAKNAKARKKWHRKIAKKLKHAIAWRDRIAQEKAAKAKESREEAAESTEEAPPQTD